MTRTPAAIWLPNGVSYVVAPVNFEMVTGAVCMPGLLVIDRAMRNSFQAAMNVMIAVVKIPGAASGMMTLRNAWPRVQPSTIAACSSSSGICRKNVVRFHTASGSANDMLGTIIAW